MLARHVPLGASTRGSEGAEVPVERFPTAARESYSDSVAVSGTGRWVFVSGQLVGGTERGVRLGEQADGCFQRIEDALASHGGTLSNVVRMTAYLTSLDDFAEFADARARRFGGNLPGSTAVQVAGLLGGALVEVDAIAFIEDGSA
jgi:2-iminobutanoate/2-iminopropanoate deaminase